MGERTSLKPRHTMLTHERTNGPRSAHSNAHARIGTRRWCFRTEMRNKAQIGTFTSKNETTATQMSKQMQCRRTLIANQTSESTDQTAPRRQSQNKRPLETSLRSVTKAHHHTTFSMHRPQTQLLQRVRPNALKNAH